MPRITRARSVVLFVLLAGSVVARPQETTTQLCGPSCLYAVCQLLGVKADIEELKKLSGYTETNGVTMWGLSVAAKSKGLHSLGMKIAAERLSELKFPVIAYLWDNHFVLVEKTDTETLLKVTDLPGKPTLVTRQDFSERYSGFVLLVSKEPCTAPEQKQKSPDLRFVEYRWRFTTEPTTQVQHSFEFRNAGDAELVISKQRKTCGCIHASVFPEKIPPRGVGRVEVTFDPTGRVGLQQQTVYIHSNDPITPLIPLNLVGIVQRELVAVPWNLSFGDIRRSERAQGEVALLSPAGEDLVVNNIASSSKAVSATTCGLAGRYSKYFKGCTVKVTLHPSLPVGPFRAILVVRTNCKKWPEVQIPVSANVVEDIEVHPSMFFFNFMKQGEGNTSRITVLTTGVAPLKIEKAEADLPFLSTDVISVREGREYVLQTTLSRAAPPGNVKATVTIHTDDPSQPRIRVPVYGFIEEGGH